MLNKTPMKFLTSLMNTLRRFQQNIFYLFGIIFYSRLPFVILNFLHLNKSEEKEKKFCKIYDSNKSWRKYAFIALRQAADSFLFHTFFMYLSISWQQSFRSIFRVVEICYLDGRKKLVKGLKY